MHRYLQKKGNKLDAEIGMRKYVVSIGSLDFQVNENDEKNALHFLFICIF